MKTNLLRLRRHDLTRVERAQMLELLEIKPISDIKIEDGNITDFKITDPKTGEEYIVDTTILEGTSYIFVSGSGTPEENGIELQEAYEAAEKMPRYLGDLSDVQFYTKYFYKGQTFKLIGFYYKVIEDCETSPGELMASDSSIDTTEEQAESNKTTILVAPGQYKFDDEFDANLSGVRITSLTGERDVIIDGDIIQTEDYQEFIGLDLGENIFVIGDNFPNSLYKNVRALGRNSFGGASVISGVFVNCTGGEHSFGGYGGTASGIFNNCEGGEHSFGGYGVASGTFNNCTGGYYSFGSYGGTASGTFNNCTGGDGSFGGYGGTASGTFTGCIGGEHSFGGGGGVITGDAKLYFCKLTGGVFTNPAAGGKLVLCIDGNDVIQTT